MPQNDTIQIELSKIIHAQLWRVVRLLTRIEDFPHFVPSVKQVRVILKHHNLMQTEWQVKIDGVPVQWVEEDTLLLDKGLVLFKAISGDLKEFQGSWRFSPHPEGTKVEVAASLKVDIPIIKDFALSYMHKLLQSNFEAILNALEQRLVSLRYATYNNDMAKNLAGFGIVGHLYNYVHLEKSLRNLRPEISLPSKEFLAKLFHVTPSFKLYDIKGFKSANGDLVDGCFIMATFIPDMLDDDIWGVFSKVVKACKIAEKHGVGIVSLGGFASIVADRIGQEVANEVDVPVTSGNTLASVMAIDGVVKAAALLSLNLSEAKMAIIGGGGDIGSACARSFIHKVKQLVLADRIKSRLTQMKAELGKNGALSLTTDNKEALRDADIVITCASATASIIPAEWFKPGAIVCDVGYPRNVSYSPRLREDIFVFQGGLCRIPQEINLPLDVGLPASNILYGCFAESILLALQRRFERFSFGRGNITLEKMDQMRNWAQKHGFEVADFYWGASKIGLDAVDSVKGALKQRP